jgi:hypothetical protein
MARLVALLATALLLGVAAPAPTQLGFTPATLVLGPGQSATVAVTVSGLSAGDLAAQVAIRHDLTRSSITQGQCAGLFNGADLLSVTNPDADPGTDWLGCVYMPGAVPASGTTGTILTFTLTSLVGSVETLTLDAPFTYFLLADQTSFEAPFQLGSLTYGPPGPTPTATATPTGTATLTPTVLVATQTVTGTPTSTLTTTGTPTGTPSWSVTPTGTPECRPPGLCRRTLTPEIAPPCWPPGRCRHTPSATPTATVVP